MKFILIADEKKAPSFFPLWQLIILVVGVILIFFILFPQHLLQKALSYSLPSPAVLNYLQAFGRLYPHDVQLASRIIEQEIKLGLLYQARENADRLRKNFPPTPSILNQLRWLDFLILRYETYHSKLNSTEHISYFHQLRQMTAALQNADLSPQQLRTIAKESLYVGQPKVALTLYKRLFAMNALTSTEDLLEGANIALQAKAPEDSAQFYKVIYDKTSGQTNKRKYAIAVIKALWAANHAKGAYYFAQQLPEDLINDRDTLILLLRLAIIVNHPEVAEKYAVKALLTNAS
jgi:polysaccharide biosynthesis protein PelB